MTPTMRHSALIAEYRLFEPTTISGARAITFFSYTKRRRRALPYARFLRQHDIQRIFGFVIGADAERAACYIK